MLGAQARRLPAAAARPAPLIDDLHRCPRRDDGFVRGLKWLAAHVDLPNVGDANRLAGAERSASLASKRREREDEEDEEDEE